MDKKEIRHNILSIRKNISTLEKTNLDFKIRENVLDFIHKKNLKKIKNIAIYLPIKNEVNATLICSLWEEVYVKFYVPDITDTNKFLMNMIEYNFRNPNSMLSKNVIDPQKLELIFVPLVGFDKNKNRVGYGKGFYDRYLKNTKKAILVGLAYEFQKVDKIDNDDNDVSLDYIITEKEII